MTLLGLILTLVLIAVVLWLINTQLAAFMDAKILKILNVVVVVVVILWLLGLFGLLGPLYAPVPRVR